MSYSTRRNPGGYGQMNNLGNVGQRRPMNNYGPGGQKPPQQPGQQQQMRPPHQSTNIQFRNQQGQQSHQQQQQPPRQVPPPSAPAQQPQPAPQQQAPQQQPPQQQAPQQQAPQQQAPQQQTPQQQAPVQPSPPPKPAPAATPQELKEESINPDETLNGDPMEIGEGGDAVGATNKKKTTFWPRKGRVSRREQMRRRNVRLSKLLQPKNAVMILNELVRTSNYIVEELPVKTDGNQFKAIVMTDTQEHCGYGRSKIQAKNDAAEAALKHFVKTNKLTEVNKDEDGNEKMDVSEDDSTQAPQPWQHLASFALFKLFSLWGEDPNSLKPQLPNAYNVAGNNGTERNENRPAKKMPPNPETINPLMLINQMLPQAKFEEIGKSGDPPNVTFSFRCNVEGQAFIGTGPNKKAAKRMAAFGACHKILGINYPTDVYVPIY